MGPRSFPIRISGPKICSAPTKIDLPYNFCIIKMFPSLTVAAVDALQTLFRGPLTPGVHPGVRGALNRVWRASTAATVTLGKKFMKQKL